MKKRTLLRYMRFWPPYLGAGIRVRRIADDFTEVDVEMKLHIWNRNYVDTHFGGSLYSMCDPFFMLMLIENLGRQYIVWDKAASIRFKRPGTGTVRAAFHLSRERIDEIRAAADRQAKVEPEFKVDVVDDSGNVIAEVTKLLYVRRKDRPNENATQ
jgi:acyl-coenzyme A thioesterase PaaI-like protein